MNVTGGLRERKKARTRDALSRAAMVRFAARGFDATTVDEIAAAAGVSRRTFFRYYPSKEAAVFPGYDLRLARFRAMLHKGESEFGHPVLAVRFACLAMADDYMANRDELLAQFRVVQSSPALMAYERELDQTWEATFVDVLRVGGDDAANQRRALVTASAILGAITTTLRMWFDEGATGDLRALGDEAIGWLEAGLRDAYNDSE